MLFPPFSVTERREHGDETIASTVTDPQFWVDFDEVILEQSLDEVRPDAIGRIAGHPYLIEIAVTHYTDDTKDRAISVLALPAIEIDLSHLMGEEVDWEILKREVIESIHNKRWLTNPSEASLRELARRNVEAKLAQLQNPSVVLREYSDKVWGMLVKIREWPYGVTVWSGYNPELTPMIRSISKSLGGRWKQKYKNWLLPTGTMDRAVEAIKRLRDKGGATGAGDV